MLELKDFYYVRHGETDWNLQFRGMGQQDIPLNETGRKQAHMAAQFIAAEPIELICHSPLSRAKETAAIVANQLGLPLLEVPELAECCWGEHEGQVKGKWTEDWIAGENLPGAETYADFLQRALRGLNKVLSHDRRALVVSHGGVFWAVQKYAQLGSRFDLRNGVPVLLRAPPKTDIPWSMTSLDPAEGL